MNELGKLQNANFWVFLQRRHSMTSTNTIALACHCRIRLNEIKGLYLKVGNNIKLVIYWMPKSAKLSLLFPAWKEAIGSPLRS